MALTSMMRLRRASRGIAAVTALGCLIAIAQAGAHAGTASPLPRTYCADHSAVFRGPQRFVGVMDNEAIARQGYFNCTLGILAHDGIGYYRTPIIWQYVEEQPGVYNFSSYDPFMALMARHHIRWLPILLAAPSFDTSAPSQGALPGYYAPDNTADFAQFARAAAQRYGPGGTFWRENPKLPRDPITTWQIWNEPNLPVYWRPQPDASAYTSLLRAGTQAIRGVDPGADVLTAGMAFSAEGIPALTYYSEMYRAGARGAFTSAALNPYAPTVKSVEQRIESVRKLMNRNGQSKTGIWITEFGWSSGGPASPYRARGPGDQARRTAQLLKWVIANRRRMRIGGAIYTLWRDERPPTPTEDYWGLHMGLLTVGAKAKPVLSVVINAAKLTDR